MPGEYHGGAHDVYRTNCPAGEDYSEHPGHHQCEHHGGHPCGHPGGHPGNLQFVGSCMVVALQLWGLLVEEEVLEFEG